MSDKEFYKEDVNPRHVELSNKHLLDLTLHTLMCVLESIDSCIWIKLDMSASQKANYDRLVSKYLNCCPDVSLDNINLPEGTDVIEYISFFSDIAKQMRNPKV